MSQVPPLPSAPPASSPLPTGTVTFLFTDVEGSTKLLNAHPDAYCRAVSRHHDLLQAAIEAHGGAVFETVGDAVYAAFSQPQDAVAAALDGQLALHRQPWGATPIRVRMGLHTGTAELKDGHYFGAPLYHCARLMATAHGGQVVLSAATAELTRDSLPAGASLRDMGEHRLKDLARPERVCQLLHADLPADFPALRTLDTLPNNLPLQLTSFIGREKELAEVTRHLGVARLLTLTGAGGSGKTRLALQAAADALEDYPDGVFLVELAPVGDPQQVPHAVVEAVGVREEEGRPLLGTLVDALRGRHLLLVLDNCEHLVDACARLVETLLRSCPGLRVLATSREALGIAGETSWRVPSLALPSPDQVQTVEALTQYEAVRLFVERAEAVLPSFEVTKHNAPAIAQICHRLDGIPLAIELAAARLKALPVDELVKRLEDRFRLLTGGSRTALPRQQTLQALVDWSYSLLAEEEKTVFARLAVFYGGFTLDAAEAVCAGGTVGEYDVLDLLTRLVDKSLVLLDETETGGGRYRLLETLRQYARQKLLDSGEAPDLYRRHAHHMLDLVLAADRALEGPDQPDALRRMDAELDNIRAALGWALDSRAAVLGLRLGAALWRFWWWRGHLTEGREWLDSLLALPEAGGLTVERACALDTAGALCQEQGEGAAAARYHQAALTIWRDVGVHPARAQNYHGLADTAPTRGEAETLYEEGLAVAHATGDRWMEALLLDHLYRTEEALAIWRQLGAPWGIANGLHYAARALRMGGDHARATALEREALAIERAIGNKWAIMGSLRGLSGDAHALGDPAEATALAGEALALARSLGNLSATLGLLGLLAVFAHAAGDQPAASARLQEGFSALADGGPASRPGAVATLLSAAAVVTSACAPHRALRLAACAETVRASGGSNGSPSTLRPLLVAALGRAVETARAALTWEEAAAAWSEGEAMSLNEAVSFALDHAGAPSRV